MKLNKDISNVLSKFKSDLALKVEKDNSALKVEKDNSAL